MRGKDKKIIKRVIDYLRSVRRFVIDNDDLYKMGFTAWSEISNTEVMDVLERSPLTVITYEGEGDLWWICAILPKDIEVTEEQVEKIRDLLASQYDPEDPRYWWSNERVSREIAKMLKIDEDWVINKLSSWYIRQVQLWDAIAEIERSNESNSLLPPSRVIDFKGGEDIYKEMCEELEKRGFKKVEADEEEEIFQSTWRRGKIKVEVFTNLIEEYGFIIVWLMRCSDDGS